MLDEGGGEKTDGVKPPEVIVSLIERGSAGSD